MNAVRLYVKNPEEKEVGWVCSNCNTVFNNQESAETCCKPIICEKCGKEINRDKKKGYIEAYYINPTRCSSCYMQDKWNDMECISEDEYNKLCKEDDHYGPVFWGDTPYEDLYEALESELDVYLQIDEVPDEVELGYWHTMDKIDIENILCNELDNCGLEEWDLSQCYTDVNELIDFVKQWNEKQTGYRYYSSAKKKVKIKPETIKEYWGDING